MKKLFSTVMTSLFFLFVPVHGFAAPIVGNIYFDTDGVPWKYIGAFNVIDGAPWFDGGPTFNGLEAAAAVFGPLGPNQQYALSTDETIVNHLAWYDGYGQIEHLNIPGQVGLPENINEDPGNDGYNFNGSGNGDWSAYIRDHTSEAQNSVNFVYASAAAVPEPATITIFGMMAVGGAVYGWRRRKPAVVA